MTEAVGPVCVNRRRIPPRHFRCAKIVVMGTTESKTFRVELEATPESIAKRECKVLRQVFGDDLDLDKVNVLGITLPMHDIVDGCIVEVSSISQPSKHIE